MPVLDSYRSTASRSGGRDLAENALESAIERAKLNLVGTRLELVKHSDFDRWEFHFDTDSSLSFQSLWRLVSDRGIEMTSADDGHQFGLKTPLNAVEILKAKIGETLITDLRFDHATSDLIFYFGPTLRLEVITTSCGYEAWSLHTKESHIIGRNGDIVVFPPPNRI